MTGDAFQRDVRSSLVPSARPAFSGLAEERGVRETAAAQPSVEKTLATVNDGDYNGCGILCRVRALLTVSKKVPALFKADPGMAHGASRGDIRGPRSLAADLPAGRMPCRARSGWPAYVPCYKFSAEDPRGGIRESLGGILPSIVLRLAFRICLCAGGEVPGSGTRHRKTPETC